MTEYIEYRFVVSKLLFWSLNVDYNYCYEHLQLIKIGLTINYNSRENQSQWVWWSITIAFIIIYNILQWL